MERLKLLLDTNIVIDFLNERKPFFEKARLLMICGATGEFELWISASQATDIVYILSGGGKRKDCTSVVARLEKLLKFVHVYTANEQEIHRMLSAGWGDPEDALLHEAALSLQADAIITRDAQDFEKSLIKVCDCDEFFDWTAEEKGISYARLEL